MKTYNKTTPDINIPSNSDMKYNKYFNQMQFKGILEDDNIYAIDQQSFKDAKNVYVDWNDRLVSRPSLQKDNLPEDMQGLIDNYGYKLVDAVNLEIGKMYVTKSPADKYTVVFYPNKEVTLETGATFALQTLNDYHLSIIEHYIICFNSDGAKIIDTNNLKAGWQNFSKFVEVPVIKRVVGSTETTYDKNEFTNSYKEEYIWSNQSQPQLPTGDANVILNTSSGKTEFELKDAKVNTDYRITKLIKSDIAISDLTTIAHNSNTGINVICIAKSQYFLVSYTNGETYTTVYYPYYSGTWLNLASISEDGNYFFFVTTDGVYRCNLGDLTWASVITPQNANSIIGTAGNNNLCCKFKTGDAFSFMTTQGTNVYWYYYGPGLIAPDGTDFTLDNKLYVYTDETFSSKIDFNRFTNSRGYTDYKSYSMCVSISSDNKTRIFAKIPHKVEPLTSDNFVFCYILGGDLSHYAPTRDTIVIAYWIDSTTEEDCVINIGDYLDSGFSASHSNIAISYTLLSKNSWQGGSASPGLKWWYTTRTIEFTITGLVMPTTENTILAVQVPWDTALDANMLNSFYVPKVLDGGYIYGHYVYSDISAKWSTLTIAKNVDIEENYTFVDNWYQRFYTDKGYLYTNKLIDNDSAQIVYTYGDDNDYTKVPSVSYSDTELYLAFDNLLQISNNSSKDDNIQFNLAPINNQSFIDNITAMKNISTTEVAIFFENSIKICSKVEDENYGFRYNYYNTKLQTGVRLGDSVINTLEGSYTLFPTKRGLAAMNYQAFMATSDQVIEYITDNVRDMWDSFFYNSSKIKIIQWRNRLILTNDTNTILLYDLDSTSWWRWEIPVNTLIAITDQLYLSVISTNLLTFRNAALYYDFSEIGNFKTIDWYVQSQPLHMSAPNYYKNMKQLVFQFSDVENENTVNAKTLVAQIKLYRKRITVRDPETVAFKIEGMRTFVKRFNYWKINEIQWGLANDNETDTPARLELNGISVKYEIGEEVR